MRIIHLILGKANPNRMNGVNRVVHNLSTAQIASGFDVMVWGITDPNTDTKEVDRSYQTQWFKPGFSPFSVDKELVEAINNCKDTCFHLHGGFIPVYYTLSKLIIKSGSTFVLTPHGTYTQGAMEGNKSIKKIYFQFFEKYVIERAKVVQCLGHAEETDVHNLVKEVKSILIPNGQSPSELALKEDFYPDANFIIGYCGRISMWHKGMDILIDSFSLYKNKYKGKGQLHLIGDGEYQEEMSLKADEAKVSEAVVFHGKKFGEDKIKTLKNMKVFVHTSRNEGLPTAVIEAVSLGLPCIVSEMTSMDRYVVDNNAGWGFKDLDIDTVAKLFLEAEKAFYDGTLKDIGTNALTMAKANFDWNVIAKQTLRMYHD